MLFNLGDLVDRSQDLDTPALIDCLDWERPAYYSHRDMDQLACAVANGLQRRGLDLLVRGRWREVEERPDVPAHAVAPPASLPEILIGRLPEVTVDQ